MFVAVFMYYANPSSIVGIANSLVSKLFIYHIYSSIADAMKGRQLLMQIYKSKNLTEAFDEFKILELMNNDEAIDLLNKELDMEHNESYCTHIDGEHPLVNYYRGVCVQDMEFVDADNDVLAKEICTIVRDKTRKTMYSKGGKNSRGERYYIYNKFEHGAEMDYIAKLLFIPGISPVNALTDDEGEDLEKLFDSSQNRNADEAGDWGEQIDFSVEEILDMPTMGEVQMKFDYPVMDCEQFSQKSSITNDLDMIDLEKGYGKFTTSDKGGDEI